MSILVLQSSWWGRESWLLCLICLPGVSWWLSGSSSRCHGVVCSLWLWYFLIILTYYFRCFFNRKYCFIKWHTHLIAISTSGDGDELGVSLWHSETMHSGNFHRKDNFMQHHLACATILVVNLVSHNCQFSRGCQLSSFSLFVWKLMIELYRIYISIFLYFFIVTVIFELKHLDDQSWQFQPHKLASAIWFLMLTVSNI